MGVTYQLFKIDKGERYDLGKRLGYLFDSIVEHREQPFVLGKALKPIFLEEFNSDTQRGWRFESEDARRKYVHDITEDIFRWCGSDRIICLSDNQEYDLDHYLKKYSAEWPDGVPFQETGTRYQE